MKISYQQPLGHTVKHDPKWGRLLWIGLGMVTYAALVELLEVLIAVLS